MNPNIDNLVPQSERTKEEQRKIAIMGGKASGEARRRKRTMKEAMDMLLSLPVRDDKVRKKIAALGIDPDEVDNQMAMVIAQWQQAVKGNTRAYENVQATIGEKPKENVAIEDTREKSRKLDGILEQLKEK